MMKMPEACISIPRRRSACELNALKLLATRQLVSQPHRFAMYPSQTDSRLRLSQGVSLALQRGDGVVALESVLIAHGLPWPANLKAGEALERTVRENGAKPATVAVIDGRMCVGISPQEMRAMAEFPSRFPKLSLRDLPRALATNACGATTVSATAHIAAAAGVRVFATGGIGGVHRGDDMDISQDIRALQTCPIVVVCAGIKSVLDIPRTLEALETAAVPVLVWQSQSFPAFYTADSGCPAPDTVNSAQDVAHAFQCARLSNTANGVLLAVPIPTHSSGEAENIERATRTAIKEMRQRHISGKSVTPFLLKRIAELTNGGSLAANVALALNNGKVAAAVANALSARRESTVPNRRPAVAVVGAVALDILCTPASNLEKHTSNIGTVYRSVGGVACNMARAVNEAGVGVRLVAAVGNDDAGNIIKTRLQRQRIDTSSLVTVSEARSATYCAIHNRSGDMEVRNYTHWLLIGLSD